jgi:hypothetical protein
MVKEFDSTAFASDTGKVVGPVLTRFGAHIIKVVDRKKGAEGDSVRASHILIKWKIGSDTEERASQKAKDFSDAAKTDGFTKAAAQFGLDVKETDLFGKNPSGNVPGFGALQPAMDWAFGSKRGNISYLFKTKARNADGYTVFQLKDIEPEGSVPVADVSSSIRGILVKKKQEKMALDAARSFRGKISSASQFASEASSEGLKIDSTGEHLQRDYLPVFGQDETMARRLVALNAGQISDAILGSRGSYVAMLVSKTDLDSAGFAAKRQDLTEQLRRTKQNRVYSDWLAAAQQEIGVVDKRYLYFTDY